jgi:hypothetical protein
LSCGDNVTASNTRFKKQGYIVDWSSAPPVVAATLILAHSCVGLAGLPWFIYACFGVNLQRLADRLAPDFLAEERLGSANYDIVAIRGILQMKNGY